MPRKKKEEKAAETNINDMKEGATIYEDVEENIEEIKETVYESGKTVYEDTEENEKEEGFEEPKEDHTTIDVDFEDLKSEENISEEERNEEAKIKNKIDDLVNEELKFSSKTEKAKHILDDEGKSETEKEKSDNKNKRNFIRRWIEKLIDFIKDKKFKLECERIARHNNTDTAKVQDNFFKKILGGIYTFFKAIFNGIEITIIVVCEGITFLIELINSLTSRGLDKLISLINYTQKA